MPFDNDSVLPLGLGTVALVGDQGCVLGLGHVGPEGPGSDLVQSWVLYPGYEGPPYQVITFQPAKQQYGSFGEWYADLTVGSLWKEGSRYVKATVDRNEQIIWAPLVIIYQNNEIVGYVEVYTAPAAASALAPGAPGAPGAGSSLSTIERWTVFDDYVPPPAASFELRPPAPGQDVSTLQALSDSRLGRSVIVNCDTYSYLPANP